MPFKTTGNIVNNLTSTLRKLLKDVTGLNLGTRVSKVTGGTLNELGKFSKKIPIAGGFFAYIFQKTGKGVNIVLTSADGLVNTTGDLVNNIVQGANDIVLYSLSTLSNTIGVKTRKIGNRRRRRSGRRHRRSHRRRGGRRRTKRRR